MFLFLRLTSIGNNAAERDREIRPGRKQQQQCTYVLTPNQPPHRYTMLRESKGSVDVRTVDLDRISV